MSSESQVLLKEDGVGEELVDSHRDLAIQATNVSKCYHLYDKAQDRLKQAIFPHLHRLLGMSVTSYAREFWALKDVCFEVKRGETVGIVGRNGSGKSTILQIIAGTLDATRGEVQVHGRVAALLELGSGFNPEFTGRENVYINAAIQGLSKNEIDAKFDDIAAFADIGEFLEQPIKTYSSGMLMRLAFAVNTCIEPEILVVDEALGVGDVPFQSKCYKRLRRLVDDGRSVLFVSHDISTVRSICSRVLWLKNGRAELWGDAKRVSKEYEKYCWKEQGISFIDEGKVAPSTHAESSPVGLKDSDKRFTPLPHSDRYGTKDVTITYFEMRDHKGETVNSCSYGEELTLVYHMEAHNDVDSDAIIGILFRDKRGGNIYAAHNFKDNIRLSLKKGQTIVASAKLGVPLTHQDYVIQVGIFGFKEGDRYSNGQYDFSRAVIWDLIEKAVILTVLPNRPQPLSGPVHASLSFNTVTVDGIVTVSVVPNVI